MRIKFYLSVLLLSLSATFSNLYAQGTFTQVHQLLQTNCAGASCHQYGGNPSFDVTLSESALYTRLINGTPVNPAAVTKGDKLISPGYVDRSFLLRKIAHGINEHLDLTLPEGADMPSGLPALKPHEIELVRQWILFGAPQTGDVVDTGMINKYYREGGINDTYASHPIPAPGTGFQIYVGKVFIQPNTETYYFIKHNPRFTVNTEIPRIETLMPQSSHHFVVYNFLPGSEGNYPEGLRGLDMDSHADVLGGIGVINGYTEYQLPANCAYFWPQNTTLDLNLHIRNPSVDSILGCDLYINVYTQAAGTAQHYMLIRNYPVFSISIPQDTAEHTFIEIANDTAETKMWKIWQMYSHTHKYGTDYDIFVRNPDGSMGNQEYEGWNDYRLGDNVNVGYYRWGTDVTFKYYPDDSLLQVDPRFGFLHRAKFKNTAGPDPILWGLTSEDEMMVMGFQYIYGDNLTPVSSADLNNETIKVNVFPNPASDAVSLNYVLQHNSDLRIELTNVLGEIVSVVEQKNKPAGNYLEEIELGGKFSPGLYLLTLQTETSITSQRLVIE